MKQHDIHNGYPVERLYGYPAERLDGNPDIRQTAEQNGCPDDVLYQQMLAELKPGAEEYDKMVAEGKHPAATKRRTIPLYKYAATACVLFAVVGGTLFMLQEGKDEPQSQQVAHIDDKKQESTDTADQLLAAEVLQQEKISASLDGHPKINKRRKHVSHPRHATQTEPLAEESFDVSINMPNQEIYHALLAEVEARATQSKQQEQQAMRALFNELIDNIEQQPNRPELSL